jgi:hypothetical protein
MKKIPLPVQQSRKNTGMQHRKPALANHSAPDNTTFAVPQQETWLDNQDILQRMHISLLTLQNWRSKRLLPYSKIFGKIYYKESDLQLLLISNAKANWLPKEKRA